MSLLFVLALLVVGWLMYNTYLKKLLQQGTPGKIKLGLVALGIIFLLMAVTGRAPALFAILGAAMTQIVRLAPFLIRFAPSLRRLLGSAIPGATSAGQGPQVSQVTTATIDMTLDHATGHIDGQVKQGPCASMNLSELSLQQLQEVYAYCQQHDPDAMRLVHTYASRARADEWHEEPSEEPGGSTGQSAKNETTMTIHEAREILGLAEDATKEDIVHAHRSLMSRLHPDKGGSNYLAAKVNAAKQYLLKALKK